MKEWEEGFAAQERIEDIGSRRSAMNCGGAPRGPRASRI